MSILAIDTSTQVSSVAVMNEKRLQAEITMQARLTHSETLMPHIEAALCMAAVKKTELEGIAVSIGPGSFTGLRIGLAAAKAMAYALSLPLVGISTLAALAVHFPAPGARILSLIDAQKGNAYAQAFHMENGQPVPLGRAEVLAIEEVLARASRAGEPVILTGDVVPKKIVDKLAVPSHVILPPPQMQMPRAANVGLLGLQRLARGASDNPMALEPVYIRRSEAEVLWERRHPDAPKGEEPETKTIVMGKQS